MSEFKVEVVPVQLEKHPNADNLSIARVYDFPVVVRTDDFSATDRGAYIPIDSLATGPRFVFLGSDRRVRARRFRGIYSEGLLMPPGPGDQWALGQDVGSLLGVSKYDPPESPHCYDNATGTNTDGEPEPAWFHRYTDIENARKHARAFVPGERVHVVEKIHGANARFAHDTQRLWVGSRRTCKKRDYSSIYWQVAAKFDLERKLSYYPWVILFGEVFGPVQSLHYGHDRKPWLCFFDAFDLPSREWWSFERLQTTLRRLDLPTAPYLGEHTWTNLDEMLPLAEGTSCFGYNIREGAVFRPLAERCDHRVGRVILKLISRQYLLEAK